MTLHRDQTTREVAIQYPAAIPVFESLGIDYCCGGAKTLGESCDKARVDWTHLVELIEAADNPTSHAGIDWNIQPLDALTWHIIDTHHAYVRRATMQIENWLEKVVAKHGAAHPEAHDIDHHFDTLSRELSAHMMKEEHVLFPYMDSLVRAERQQFPPARAHFGSADFPIRQMMLEHDNAGELMAEIRNLSSGYAPPPNACPTFRALYHGLAEFEQDLHQHVHLENNILFPRATELEHRLFKKWE